MKVLIVFNACPSEFPQKLDSISHEAVAEEVADVHDALIESGHEVLKQSIGANISADLAKLLSTDCDVIFNLCESLSGNSLLESAFASFLDCLPVPHTGANGLSLSMTSHKTWTNAILEKTPIRVPRAFTLSQSDSISYLQNISIPFPVICKLNIENASIGIDRNAVCNTLDKLVSQVSVLQETYNSDILIQSYIIGREFSVGVLGNNPYTILAPYEICFDKMPQNYPKIVTYLGKWDPKSVEYIGSEPIPFPAMSPQLLDSLKYASELTCKALGITGYARIDFRVDNEENPYIIDVNPNPDISRNGGYARSAQAAGLDYTELIIKIINCAVSRETVSGGT